MKNFTIMLTALSFFLIVIGTSNLGALFIGLGIAWIVSLICLMKYLGKIWGLIVFILLTIIPPYIESLLVYKSSWFVPALIRNFTPNTWLAILDPQLIALVFLLSISFTGALFLGKKIITYTPLSKYGKKGLVIISSVLFSATLLEYSLGFNFKLVIRWLILSLIYYSILSLVLKFKPKADSVYKNRIIDLFLIGVFAWSIHSSQWIGIVTSIIFAAIYISIKIKERKLHKQLSSASPNPQKG